MLVARKWPEHAGPAGGQSARECVGREGKELLQMPQKDMLTLGKERPLQKERKMGWGWEAEPVARWKMERTISSWALQVLSCFRVS